MVEILKFGKSEEEIKDLESNQYFPSPVQRL